MGFFENWANIPSTAVKTIAWLFGQMTGNNSAFEATKDWNMADNLKDLFGNAKTGITSIFDGLTGKTNTDATNSATAALQEDAQSFNAEEAQKQRDFEAEQAEIARKWQENMSNTAIQRQQADLKAAGLNPWLAANGNGASTGSVGIAMGDSASSAQGQAINATKSGAEMIMMAGITAASIYKILKLLKH